MRNKKTDGIGAKGYYIALVLCAVAIVIAGALYYRGTQTPEMPLEETPVQNGAVNPTDIPAGVTQPEEGGALTVEAKKPANITKPVQGTTIAPYAMETLGYNQTTRDWRVHDGIDVAAEAGTAVCAAADGQVYTVYEDESMGMTVVIRHEGGYTTRYASLDAEVAVKAGDQVAAGDVIGKVGNTALLECGIGDHLHFSVSCGGTAVDPAEFLN